MKGTPTYLIKNEKNLLISKLFVLISDFIGKWSSPYIGAENPSDIVAQYAKSLSSAMSGPISNRAIIDPIAINQSASNASPTIVDIAIVQDTKEK